MTWYFHYSPPSNALGQILPYVNADWLLARCADRWGSSTPWGHPLDTNPFLPPGDNHASNLAPVVTMLVEAVCLMVNEALRDATNPDRILEQCDVQIIERASLELATLARLKEQAQRGG